MASTITINGNSLDLSTRQMLAFSAAANTRYIIIRSREALTDPEKGKLISSGVDITSYVDTNTYLCIYDSDNLEELRTRNKFLDHVDIYHRVFKIHANLKRRITTNSEENSPEDAPGALSAGIPFKDGTIPIVIGLHAQPKPTTEEIVRDLITGNLIKYKDTATYPGRIDTVISPQNIWALEAIDSIQSVTVAINKISQAEASGLI
ncbi:hypothetical protein BDV95DRAFT_605544 [Massariosphaeria phaeospora]|uniref:Uncharacterized protein n=1 Tax=Massariosphaeria phaeospora TaxID=100035 RepID=A0A7C8M9Q4_9PLEO|nr:hypothetical protein BDV95DRAFT_605544 [Massariosphaeria phaeospora]